MSSFGRTSAQINSPKLQTIVELVSERLSWMQAVATYKYHTGMPIEDKEREAVVLRSSIRKASQLELDSLGVKEFYQVQILIAKKLQTRYIRDLEGTTRDPAKIIFDLDTNIRPNLLRIGDHLLKQIAQYLDHNVQIDPIDLWHYHDLLSVAHLKKREKRLILDNLCLVKKERAGR